MTTSCTCGPTFGGPLGGYRAPRIRARPDPTGIEARRTESLALLAGLIDPTWRPSSVWWSVSPRPGSPRWTLNDEVRWFRRVAPWLVIHGAIGCDGCICCYRIVGGAPRNDEERAMAGKNDADRLRLGAEIDALFHGQNSPPPTQNQRQPNRKEPR